MTLPTLQVLKVLRDSAAEGCYGLEIARETGLATGSIYPILARLEQTGWVDSAWEDIDEVAEGRRRRRYYRLTIAGAEKARAALQSAQEAIAELPRLPSGLLRPGPTPT